LVGSEGKLTDLRLKKQLKLLPLNSSGAGYGNATDTCGKKDLPDCKGYIGGGESISTSDPVGDKTDQHFAPMITQKSCLIHEKIHLLFHIK